MKLGKKFSQTLLQFFLFTAVFFQYIIFIGCTEKPMTIGSEILPDDDLLAVYDSVFPVELITKTGKSLSEKVFEDRSFLGSINRQDLGLFQAGFLTNYIPTAEANFRFDSSISVTGLKLYLVYNNSIGTLNEMLFEVYELIEPLPKYDSSDYTVLPHMIESTPIASINGIGNILYNSNSDDADTAVVILSNEFAEKLIDPAILSNTSIYNPEDSESFQSMFKGLYFKSIASTANKGGIIEINHELSRMELIVDITRGSNVVTDTTMFYLGYSSSPIDIGGDHLNIYNFSSSGKTASALNDATSTDAAYLFSPAGTRILLEIPGIQQLKSDLNGKISVNRAELILPYSEELNNINSIPQAGLLGVYDSKTQSPISDNLLEGYLNGYRNSNDNRYLLNIGNHLQDYLTGSDSESSESFYIFISNPGSTLSTDGRDIEYVILNGSTAKEDNPYLRIVYSKIP